MPKVLLGALVALTVSASARGSDLPPWRDASDLPLPEGARSVVVARGEQAILAEPTPSASRRGTVVAGSRLPFYGVKRGSGCAARWVNVGPEAWICQDALAFDTAPPPPALDPASRQPEAPSGLPFRYYFVGAGGSTGYYRLEDAEEVAPDQELEPGFAVAVVDDGVKGGARFVRTHHGLWVPARDLTQVAPFLFHGEEIAESKLDFGWVVEDRAPVFSKPANQARVANKVRARFDKVEILEIKTDKSGGFVRIGDGEWLRGRDIRAPRLSPPPSAIGPHERWIDVDLATQTLLALEGDKPLFATLVSTGKGPEGTDTATPKGEFRIWVKLTSSNMDNLEDEDAQKYYAIEDVPFVQYFAKGVGLHGAFWHRGFGHVRSHGCVNLAPRDAQRLFAFTSPHLPTNWAATLPTSVEEGTLVRVR